MDNSQLTIRHALLSDLSEMKKLFVETIETICKNDYSPEQITAWTLSVKQTDRWIDKLLKQYFLVAQSQNKIIGYCSLEGNDYLDFLYVHKDFQQQGLANRLYNEIEREAIKRGSRILNADVSITAKPFFEKQGFKTPVEQKIQLNGVEIINFKMTKALL